MDRFTERTTFEETEPAPQPENEVTEADLAAQDAEELAIFGPRCSVRDALICQAQTIDHMRLALRAHEAECVHCQPARKPMTRDIQLEQTQASTNAQLADRLTTLVARYGRSGFPLTQLAELHMIRYEQARRAVAPKPMGAARAPKTERSEVA
jgi:hypothetical protein